MHLFRGHAGLGADVEKENLAAYIILSMHGVACVEVHGQIGYDVCFLER